MNPVYSCRCIRCGESNCVEDVNTLDKVVIIHSGPASKYKVHIICYNCIAAIFQDLLFGITTFDPFWDIWNKLYCSDCKTEIWKMKPSIDDKFQHQKYLFLFDFVNKRAPNKTGSVIIDKFVRKLFFEAIKQGKLDVIDNLCCTFTMQSDESLLEKAINYANQNGEKTIEDYLTKLQFKQKSSLTQDENSIIKDENANKSTQKSKENAKSTNINNDNNNTKDVKDDEEKEDDDINEYDSSCKQHGTSKHRTNGRYSKRSGHLEPPPKKKARLSIAKQLKQRKDLLKVKNTIFVFCWLRYK